jgi:nucleotide-binding universal stress UspA family protein
MFEILKTSWRENELYKKILIPVDLAHMDAGKGMIDVARNVASDGASMLLAHVVADIPTYVAAELPGGIIEKSKETARSALEGLVKDAGIKADIEVRSGHPRTAILSIAEEMKADLVIIASHKPGLQDYFLGSTASSVVRHAKCSVLVMR